MSTIYAKQQRYRANVMARREQRYLDIGLSPDEWRSMTADQMAVYKRWYQYYAKRRALRELLRGDVPLSSQESVFSTTSNPTSKLRLPLPESPSPPSSQAGFATRGAGPRKPRGKK